jgi:hypothetical protein
MAQGRDRWRALLNAVMNLRIPQNSGNFFTSSECVSFTGRPLFHGVSELISLYAKRSVIS